MPNHAADRNLLFGILALKMDFIASAQLVDALNNWVTAKQTPLGQILVDQRALAPDRQRLLDAVVDEHLKLHDNDLEKSLAAVGSPPAVHEHLKRIPDHELQTSLGHACALRPEKSDHTEKPADPYATNLPQLTAVDPYATNLPRGAATAGGAATPAHTAPHHPGSRFRVLRPFARGGLGEVLVAEDGELHREVALKQIQDRHADDLESRNRFVQEAEITGGLEHPGIVPVYGLGQYADGRPYYAMRFIRGDSLKEAIDAFHAADTPGRDPGERTLQLRHLLGRFIDVCEAIAYAHARGVLHRDLKPGNIMLGKYGETLVVDWGLAKPMDAIEVGGKDAVPEGKITLSGSVTATPTMMGLAVGTPQFMSPEQAAGRLNDLSPASDVYSLGATLYALLCGSVPVPDADVTRVLERVQRGDIPAPRSVKPNVPPALEAICMKAMALKPLGRYATPKLLAEDLEHWLADEPVTAYREPWSDRAARWLRRHRTLATGIAAAVVVAAVGFTIATVIVTGAWDRERQAKLEAIDQRNLAEKNFRLARSAVDRYHTEVSENDLLHEPGMQPLRKKLLAAAGEFYAKFVDERGNDVALKGELGRAIYRLAQITADIESDAKALELFHKAEKIFAKEGDEYRTDLARVQHHLGRVYRLAEHLPESEEHYRKALDLWPAAVEADAKARTEAARSQMGMGNLLQLTRRLEKAAAQYKLALDGFSAAVREYPDVPELLRDQATAHSNLGMIYGALGNKDAAAVDEVNKAVAIQEKLIKAHPNVSKYQDDLARSHVSLGEVHLHADRPAEALAEYDAALKLWQGLTKLHPTMLYFHWRLAEGHSSRAYALRDDGKLAEAIKACRQALAIDQDLLAKESAPKHVFDVAERQRQLADLLRFDGQAVAAEKAYKDVLALHTKLAPTLGATPHGQAALANTYTSLGLLRLDQRQAAAAEEAFGQSIATWEKLLKRYPDTAEFARGMADACMNLRGVLRLPGAIQVAVGPLDQAVHVLASHRPAEPVPDFWRQARCQAHWTRAEALARQGKHEAALLDWDQAIGAARKADLPWLTVNRLASMAGYGQIDPTTIAEAEKYANKALEAKSGAALSGVARIFASAAESTLKASGSAGENKRRSDQYAQRALELLGQARDCGHFKNGANLEGLRADPEWQVLRSYPAFTALTANRE